MLGELTNKTMTQEEKQLLLRDLCTRLPYRVVVSFKNSDTREAFNQILDYTLVHMVEYIPHIGGIEIKPYLRSMSSMTEEERDEFRNLGGVMSHNSQNDTWVICAFTPEAYDWLNEHHFDYRGLIEKGLAIEAPEDMYNTKIE